MSSKILITGGCGYIGSHTSVDLLQKGFEVVSIDNFLRGMKDVPQRVKKITGKQFRNYEIDLCKRNALRKFFKEEKNIAGIVHFAAFKMVGESVQQPLIYYRNNLFSLINLLGCVQEFNIPNFIFSSSSSVYGNIEKLPVNESTPVARQESPYGKTKYWGEEMIADAIKANPFCALSLRYFNPAGSHESALIGEKPEKNPQNIVPAITRTAAGKQKELVIHGNDYSTRDGTCIRDYPHVMDVAEAHTMALQFLLRKNSETKSFNDVINIGTSNGVSVMEMILAFEKATGMKLNYKVGPRRAGDAYAIYTDIAKAEKMLGWKPKRTLEDILRSAWKWENKFGKKQN